MRVFRFDGHYKGGKIYWISDTTALSLAVAPTVLSGSLTSAQKTSNSNQFLMYMHRKNTVTKRLIYVLYLIGYKSIF
jgi:hypothetical protein